MSPGIQFPSHKWARNIVQAGNSPPNLIKTYLNILPVSCIH